MFQTNVVEEIKTHFLFSITIFSKSCRSEIMWKNIVEPDINIKRRMCIACWITKATNTHAQYITLLFHSNDGYTNAPQCYVMPAFACILLYHPLAYGSQRKALVSSYDHATKGSRTIRGRCTEGESMGLLFSVVTYSAVDCA